MISITNTKELHNCILGLVAESDESLRKHLKPWEKLEDSVQEQYEGQSPRFDVRHIWADALNIPDHLQVIAHCELSRREAGRPPLEFVNF